LDYRITSLENKTNPFISDEIVALCLMVEQTPSELILIALTQLNVHQETLTEIIIDRLWEVFAFCLSLDFDESNLQIDSMTQDEFIQKLCLASKFFDSRMFLSIV
jgi:hypothetical protein